MWQVFIPCGVVLSVALWAAQRSTWSVWMRVVLVLLLLAVASVYVYLATPNLITLGPEAAWYNVTPIREALLFLIMLTGMAARYFTQEIEARRVRMEQARRKGIDAKPGLEFDIWEFAYPLFFSVVTFGALLSQIKETTLSLASLILSFQTGFFWQTLLVVKPARRR